MTLISLGIYNLNIIFPSILDFPSMGVELPSFGIQAFNYLVLFPTKVVLVLILVDYPPPFFHP
jgi:hypothetical protein